MTAVVSPITGGTGSVDAILSGAVVPMAGSSGNVANVPGLVILTPPAGRLAYLSGFTITGSGSTAGGVLTVFTGGLAAGTFTYILVIPVGASTSIIPLIVNFPQPLPATSPGIGVSMGFSAFGTGNTNSAVTAHGFYV